VVEGEEEAMVEVQATEMALRMILLQWMFLWMRMYKIKMAIKICTLL
jgi:hypothetical protein